MASRVEGASPQAAPEAVRTTPRDQGWLGNARRAAAFAADQVELWLPGTLAALAFLGWLPFVLVVATLPTVGDLGFFVSSVVLAPSYPVNAILLGSAAALAVTAASVIVATGETALVRGIDEVRRGRVPQRALDYDAARAWFIQLVASLPALAALALVGLTIASAAPGEYQSPDLGTPLVLRVLGDVWPAIAVLLGMALVGQSFAAAAQRSSILDARGLAAALAAGAKDLVHHPVRRLATALATAVALAAWLAVSWALLQVLWSPLGRAASEGTLLSGAGAVLLAGFVAIWLCLLAAGGAVAAWASAWWSLEVTDAWS